MQSFQFSDSEKRQANPVSKRNLDNCILRQKSWSVYRIHGTWVNHHVQVYCEILLNYAVPFKTDDGEPWVPRLFLFTISHVRTRLPTQRKRIRNSNWRYLTTHLIILTSRPVTAISSYTSRTALHFNDSRNLKKLNENLSRKMVEILYGVLKQIVSRY